MGSDGECMEATEGAGIFATVVHMVVYEVVYVERLIDWAIWCTCINILALVIMTKIVY